MEPIDILGVKVLFPFKPYDIQLDYMKNVIKCLQEKTNGLLESPTGTGKTLCILCSTLGWLDTQRMSEYKKLMDNMKTNEDKPKVSLNGWQLSKQLPQILYSSRTHQQLSQACKELKRTSYNSYKSVVIGSRDQLCLDPEVSKLESISAKNQSCRLKVKHNSCNYYRNYEQKVERSVDFQSNQVLDIEDLMKFGQKSTCCPYYASRYIQTKASLVFTPYNYILDPLIRQSNKLELKDSVVIFDEGHNIEKMCEESVSTEIRSDTFALCIKHLDSVLQSLKDIDDGSYEGLDAKELNELNVEDLAKLKLFVSDLEMSIDIMIKEKTTQKTTHDTKDIFTIMESSGLNVTSISSILGVIDKISMLCNNSDSNMNSTQTQVVVAALNALESFISTLFPKVLTTNDSYIKHKLDFIKKFKIFSEKGCNSDEEKASFWSKKSSSDSWVLHIWCLSPSVGAKALLDLGIHTMIITSGTLAPINSFESEMELNFPIKLQNSHIIGSNQLSIINISHSRDKTVLTSKYDNRDNLNYYKGLGYTMIEVLRVVPKGVLVFFSSYTSMNKCIEIWKKCENLWPKLNGVKQIFLEPRGKKVFNDCIVKYKLKVDETNANGAAFFGVCRGKLSEGIDLPNDYCRCVIMTGLPFPSIADPRVVLKKQYLNEAKTKLTADGWYTLQMKRTLNQAIGRVVRHKDDFGAIILMDSRFSTLNDGLSKWVEKFIVRQHSHNLDENIRKLKTFFSLNQSSYKCSEISPSVANKSFVNERPKPVPQFKKHSNIFQNSPKNGFRNENTILNAFKSTGNMRSNETRIQSNSIFDSISSQISRTTNGNKTSSSSANNTEVNDTFECIDLEPSPVKKTKLNVPLKSITVCEDKTPNKLQSIIKNKSIVESNSVKKVHWNETQNIVHKLDPIVIDSELESSDGFTVIESKSSEVKTPEIKDRTIKASEESNQQLLEVWRKNGAELKNLFKETKNFDRLCQSIRCYKKYKNLCTLSMTFDTIFKKVEKQSRDQYIRDLSIIVPKSERHIFLKRCSVELSATDLSDNKEFKVINRENTSSLR